MPAESEAKTLTKFLALGDSYTIGQSVPPAQSWPHLLADTWKAQHGYRFEVEIVAVTGWTTEDLNRGIDRADPQGPYDMVSLLIGVNDQYRGFDPATYRPRLETLIDRAVAFAGGDSRRVFLISIPDYAYTPFGSGRTFISQGVNAYNSIMAQTAADYGLPFLNITPISRRGLDQPGLIAEDELHPSGDQYRLWVEEVIMPFVEKQIA